MTRNVVRFVITDVPKEHEKEMIEVFAKLCQQGIIKSSDVHMRNEVVE